MKRHARRLLIPGLLVGLLVVVLVAALLDRAEAADDDSVDATRVSRIGDLRIAESSGLAVSREHDDLAYTINDSGNAPVVYAVKVSTGAVVGLTTIRHDTYTLLDPEALALRDGTLWVADTGDNGRRRDDVALFALDEPGPGDHTARPTRYPVRYEDVPQDVEGLAVPPDGGRMLLLSKGPAGGRVYELPKRLREGRENVATRTERDTPPFTSDATYTDDGHHVLVRNYLFAQVRDADSWDLVRTDLLPQQPLGETIAIEPSGRSYLVGSEGARSALWRIELKLGDPADPAPAPSESVPPADSRVEVTDAGPPWVPIAGVGAAVAVLVLVIVLVRRRARRS